MTTIDLVLSIVLVLAAAGFVVWNTAFRRAAPSCCPPPRREQAQAGSNVILDDKLARAVAKARAKRTA